MLSEEPLVRSPLCPVDGSKAVQRCTGGGGALSQSDINCLLIGCHVHADELEVIRTVRVHWAGVSLNQGFSTDVVCVRATQGF